MKPSELLRAAAKDWTVRQWERLRQGDCTNTFCPIARVYFTTNATPDEAMPYTAAFKFLGCAMGTRALAQWNAEPGRTFPEVLAAFEKAAQLAESEGQ